jgi:hypothetical protein
MLNMSWCKVGITRYFDRIPAWVNDPIGVQKQREMLVAED